MVNICDRYKFKNRGDKDEPSTKIQLFLFLSLPADIPESQFLIWDRQIYNFLWNKTKPRIKLKTLQLEKGRGDLALPKIKDYFLAAQLRYIVYCRSSEYYAKCTVY